jgi:hypothetical protein
MTRRSSFGIALMCFILAILCLALGWALFVVVAEVAADCPIGWPPDACPVDTIVPARVFAPVVVG